MDARRALARGRFVTALAGTLLLAAPVTAADAASSRPRTDARASAPIVVPRFVEETAQAGLDHVSAYGDTPETPRSRGEFVVGGGLAVLDCDADGDPDVYAAGGSGPAGLYRNVSTVGGSIRFEHVPGESTDLVSVSGAYPLDVDADGVTDLAVLRLGENVLLRGLGDCRFERGNERWGFDGGKGWTTAFSATWEPGLDLPTLAVGDYEAVGPGLTPVGGCADNHLFRAERGSDRYGPALALRPGWCALSMLFSDWDRSGRRDLRIANDRQVYVDAGEEQLWRIEPGKRPRLYGRRDGWQRLQIWGMGIASHDVTGDGYPEVYLTTFGPNRLQTLARGPRRPTYREMAGDVGVEAGVPFTGGDPWRSTAWHAEFQDVNADGWIDLFVSKGNVDRMPDNALRDPSDLFLGQPDGTFREAADAAGILNFERARGASLVDANLDGLLDLLLVNQGSPVRVWRNVGSGEADAPAPLGHWLALRLRQEGPNRDAIGAWIEVDLGDRTIEREVTVGGGHAGGQLGWIHLGLGDREAARVRVRWPDGTLGPWQRATADGWAIIERGAKQPRAWTPGSGAP